MIKLPVLVTFFPLKCMHLGSLLLFLTLLHFCQVVLRHQIHFIKYEILHVIFHYTLCALLP